MSRENKKNQLRRQNAFETEEELDKVKYTKKKLIRLDSMMPNISSPFSALETKPEA